MKMIWKKRLLVAAGVIGLTLSGCTTTGNTEGSEAETNGAPNQAIAVSLPAELTTLDTTQTTVKATFTIVQHLFEGSTVSMKTVNQFQAWQKESKSVKMAKPIPLLCEMMRSGAMAKRSLRLTLLKRGKS